MKTTTNIRASTLSEMMIVMILSGIILLSVFDGLLLFKKLLAKLEGKLSDVTSLTDIHYRLERLFITSDSVLENNNRLELYRMGMIRNEIEIEDSLLIATDALNNTKQDTLLFDMTDIRIVRKPNTMQLIDSIFITTNSLTLGFGFSTRPELQAEELAIQTEQKYNNNENR